MRIENKTHERPDREIETRSRWDPAQASEEDGQVDFAPGAARWGAPADEPDEDRGDEADEEGPDERAVEGVFAEEAVGADDAPKDAAVEVDARDGAGEAVDGVRGADVRDVGEHPVQDGDLDEAGDEGGGELDFEEEFGGDFHVVAQFEVGGEFHALGRGDIAVCDEDLMIFWHMLASVAWNLTRGSECSPYWQQVFLGKRLRR